VAPPAKSSNKERPRLVIALPAAAFFALARLTLTAYVAVNVNFVDARAPPDPRA